MAEVGDRVRLKAKLPDLEHGTGWQGAPGNSEPILKTWSEHFGGQPGMVDAVDAPNNAVRVRGYDRDGQEFTIWIGHKYLEVTRAALDFSGEGG